MAELGTEFKSSGITDATPKNIMLGAGTIHKGLTFTPGSGADGSWNFEESLMGATSGGTKLTITPEFYDPEIDGAWVKVKGLTQKVGETASMEINFAEIKPELLKYAVVGDATDSKSATGYTELTSRARISEGDYVEKLGFVGKTLDGKPIIVIFDYALCTSGVELNPASKEAAVMTLTFECCAPLSADCDKLPYHIYYPTPASDPEALSVETKSVKTTGAKA